jgi:hypothetical protein
MGVKAMGGNVERFSLRVQFKDTEGEWFSFYTEPDVTPDTALYFVRTFGFEKPPELVKRWAVGSLDECLGLISSTVSAAQWGGTE